MKKFIFWILFWVVFVGASLSFFVSYAVLILIKIPITAWRSMELEWRQIYAKFPQEIRTVMPLQIFDSNGLMFDIEHLNSLNVLTEIEKPIEELAQYADAICCRRCKAQDHSIWVEAQEIDRILNEDRDMLAWFLALNITSFGNMAYIALNYPTSGVRVSYKAWLDKAKRVLVDYKKSF